MSEPDTIYRLLQPLLAEFDEESIADTRDYLIELAGHEDSRVREASRCWRAALGAFLVLQQPQPTAPSVRPSHLLELFALGAESWLDYFDALLTQDGSARARGSHIGLLRLSLQPTAALRALLVCLRSAMQGDSNALSSLPHAMEHAIAAMTGVLNDDDDEHR